MFFLPVKIIFRLSIELRFFVHFPASSFSKLREVWTVGGISYWSMKTFPIDTPVMEDGGKAQVSSWVYQVWLQVSSCRYNAPKAPIRLGEGHRWVC